MISIRKSVDDLERRDELKKRDEISKILACYSMAIQSSAHYAVEVVPAFAAEHRQHLQVIEEQSRSVVTSEQLYDVQASFRGELREYRDRSVGALEKLHKEIENATAAMMIFAESVASNGINHEQAVHAGLRGLETTARSTNIDEIRNSIGSAISSIETSVEQMQHGNRLVVAQLQDEIRVLHQEIASERKALYTDRASGAWNRQKIDLHIDNLLRQNQPFCLLLVSMRNYKRLEGQLSRTVFEGTLKALFGRLATIAGEDSVIGRWSEDQFIAVLDIEPGSAIALSAEANRKLSGGYSVQENGLAQKVAVQATSGIVDRDSGTDANKFREKLEQLSAAIAGA